MPTHSMGRSQRSRCAGFTIGSMDLTASVHSSNIQLTCPQRLNERMISDFRRVHATSPCLSTAIGNRQLPRDEGLDHPGWFLFPFVGVPPTAGSPRFTFI